MNLSRKHSYRVPASNPAEIDDAVLTATEMGAAKLEWPLPRRTLGWFWAASLLLLIALGSRVFYLAVIQGELYQGISSDNRIQAQVIAPPRGVIYDRFNEPLVHNTPSIDLVARAALLPADEAERTKIKERLSAFGIDRSYLDVTFDALHPRSSAVVPIKERISQEEALRFMEERRQLPGIELYQTAHREYRDSYAFAHLLGYEGKIKEEELREHPDYLLTDSIGKQGIEKSYEPVLRGKHGFRQAEVDSMGRVVTDLGTVNPVSGNDLILNIDAGLQRKIHEATEDILKERNLKSAAVIALDPRDGAVRALLSFPSFDSNLFAKGIAQEDYSRLINDPARPLFNRALSGEYPPGSTIKPVLASAALSENLIDPEYEIESRGGISVGSFFFGDWKAHGFTDMRRAIAVSSDVYFYSIGGGYGGVPGLGMERMKKYESLFGFGSETGIDVPGEADGNIPDPAWKQERFGERWYIGDDYNSSIGQGYVLATPLQILNSIATIANGGTLYRPHVGAAVRRQDGKVEEIAAEIIREGFIRPEHLQIVREGMRQTVTEGTAQQLKDLPVAVAAKTGTAQFGTEERTHGWLVSFAPFEAPELAMIVLIEGQGEETYNAVPITRAVYEWYFSEEQRNKRENR